MLTSELDGQQAQPVDLVVPSMSNEEAPPAYNSRPQYEAQASIPPLVCTADSLAHLPPGASISDDLTTTYIDVSKYGNNTEAILGQFERQAALAPRPIVRIRGTHRDWVYSWGNLRIDFDLFLDVTNLITPKLNINPTYRTVLETPGLTSEESLRYWIECFSTGQENR